MKGKIIFTSLLTALILSANAASALPSSAIVGSYVGSSDGYTEHMKDFIQLNAEDCQFLDYKDLGIYDNYDNIYIKNNGLEVIKEIVIDNYIRFDIADGKTPDDLKEYLDSYNAQNSTSYSIGYDGTVYTFAKNSVESIDEARKLCDMLKTNGLISSFTISELREQLYGKTHYLTTYDISYLERLDSFISEENFIDCAVDIVSSDMDSSVIQLKPNTELSIEEHVAIAENIFEHTGIRPNFEWIESTQCSDTNIIDLFNAVNGDANSNGSLDLGDAVLVLQNIANPDKYGLSSQGSYNADMDGGGVTANDALIIQKQLLNISE